MSKRNVLTDGFTAEDFASMHLPNNYSDINTILAKHANKLLAEAKREAVRVYGGESVVATFSTEKTWRDTHTGLLICVEPIEELKAQGHPLDSKA